VKISEDLKLVDGAFSGFHAYAVTPKDDAGWNYRLRPGTPWNPVRLPDGDPLHPYHRPPTGLRGTLVDPAGRDVAVTLLPHGSSLLRRATFPDVSGTAAP
jgi:hypothetical protein